MKVRIPQHTQMVMVKLFGETLEGIAEVTRNEAAIYQRRVQEAKELGIKPGAKREGKIDTGRQLVKNSRLDVGNTIIDLEEAGFDIDDIHVEQKGDVPMLVAVMSRREGGAQHPLRGNFIDKLGVFIRVNVWLNPRPDGSTNMTFNYSERALNGMAPGTLDIEVEAPANTPTT